MKCVSQRILTFSVAVTWTVVKRDGQLRPKLQNGLAEGAM